MEINKIVELEERIKILEDKLNKISFTNAKEVTITGCPIGEVRTGNNSSFNTENCPIGAVFSDDIEEAESRLDEINGGIDEAESKLSE